MTLHNKGFTLVELLLATALLALVMSMLATALGASRRVVDSLREQDGVEQQAQTALHRLHEDLAAAFAEPTLPFSATQGKAQRGLHLEEGQADNLIFASMGHLVFMPQEQYQGPALIAYRVEAEADDPRRLKLLRSDVPLLLAQASDADFVEKGFLLLADGLRAVQFKAVDERGETWRYWAVSSANGMVEVALPAALQIRLDFWLDVDSGRSQVYETAVLMPAGLIRTWPQRMAAGAAGN